MLPLKARAAKVVLLDFLAPSLNCRAFATASKATRDVSPLIPRTSGNKIKQKIPVLNSTKDAKSFRTADTALFNQVLVTIRQAVAQQDIASATKCLLVLKDKGLFHLLPRLDRRAVSELIRVKSSKLESSSSQWKMAEEIALLTAAENDLSGLIWCILTSIGMKEPDAAISLYGRFVQQSGVQNAPASKEQTEEEEGEASSEGNDTSADPDRITLVLGVVTAHAMKGSFRGALSAYLAAPVRICGKITENYLGGLRHIPSLHGKVKMFVERLETARWVARPMALTKQIRNLSETRSTAQLELLYKGIVDGCSGPDAYIAADETLVNDSKPIGLTTIMWTAFISAFLKCKNQTLAQKVWEDRTKLGLKPTISMWTAVLDAYEGMGDTSDAVSTWNMMKSQRAEPDALAYRAIISAQFRGEMGQDALANFQEFQQKCEAKSTATRVLVVYNTVISGLLWGRNEPGARSLLQTMSEKGPAPDVITYNTFLRFYSRRQDFRSLADIVKKMSEAKITGDVFTFSTILSGLLKAGKTDAPELVLQLMKKQGVQPNIATYTAIITQQMRENKEENLHSAFRLIQIMEKEPKLQPNEVTYTVILKGVCLGGWLSAEKSRKWKDQIVERMKHRKVPFGLPTYHTVLEFGLSSSEPKGLQESMACYKEMKERQIQFTDDTWYIILAGLLHRKAYDIARDVIRDMEKMGYMPKRPSLRNLIEKVVRSGREV